MPRQLTDDEIGAIVAQEIASSLAYDKTELSRKRAQAIEYMRGEMKEWPAEAGRSSVVSRDTSDTISWILPGIIRLLTASDRIALCEPTEPSDEQWAEQATEGVNYVFLKENEGYKLLYDGTHNSLLHGNGVIKHWWDDRPKIKTSFHSGLSDEALIALTTPEEDSTDEDGKPCEEIEVLAQTTKMYRVQEMDEQGQPVEQEIPYHEVKIKRTTKYGCVKLAAVAPEDFLISSEAISIKGARLVGQKEQKTRSDLIQMGFDRDKVDALAPDEDDEETEQARREFERFDSAATKALENVTLYELYLKLDVDGDGIAETCQIFYAGVAGSGTVLEWNVWEDEDVFSDIPCDPVPHRWDANSIFDKTKDIQEIKTVLERQALDNLYGTNNPQRFATGRILNPDELTNPSFGGTVFGENGATVIPLQIPFFANHAFEAIGFFDTVIERRTGVSKTTMALDPEALQDQTATAAQLAHDAAYSQTELIARNQAELGWKNVFRAILKLMIRHQDRARTIRLTNKQWVEIDPRHWNADMDVTINTGLGTGSRDRDMAMLGAVQQDQVMLAAGFKEAGMIDKAVAMLPKLAETVKKKAEAAGIKSPEQFYVEVTDEEVQAAVKRLAEAQAQGDPKAQIEQKKLEAEMAKGQMQIQMDQQKMQAQMAADQQKAVADLQLQREKMTMEGQLKREQIAAELQLKREQLIAEMSLKRELSMAEIEMKREQGFYSADMKAATSGVHVGGEPG